MAEYIASTADKPISILNLGALEEEVSQFMEKGAFDYIQSGAESEWTLRRNEAAFDDRQILPRVLSGVENPNLSTRFMGIPLSTPIIMAPAAAHGLAHKDGEVATAKGVAQADTLMCISNYANRTLEDIAAAGGGSPQMFQLYMSNDDSFN